MLRISCGIVNIEYLTKKYILYLYFKVYLFLDYSIRFHPVDELWMKIFSMCNLCIAVLVDKLWIRFSAWYLQYNKCSFVL